MAYKYLRCVTNFMTRESIHVPLREEVYVPLKEVLSIEPVALDKMLVTLMDRTNKIFSRITPEDSVPATEPLWLSFKKWEANHVADRQ